MENFENERYISSYFAYLNKQRVNPAPVPFIYRPVKQSDKIKARIREILGVDYNADSFEERLLTLSFEDKEKLLALLLELLHLTGDKRLLALIDKVKLSLDNEVEEEKEEEKEKKNYTEADTSDEDAKQKAIDNKAKNYGDFAFEKAKNHNFTATKQPTIDTREFDGLSRNELVSMFRPNVFYSLSPAKRHKLCQAIVNDYCHANGVSPCALDLDPLPCGKGYMTFGEYVPCAGKIVLNSHFFDNIDEFSEESNPAFPYKILQTLVHEAEHRIQFMNIDNAPTSEADALVKDSLLEPQQRKSFSQYLAEPDEVGARNAALAYFRECAESCKHPDEAARLACFYNCQKKEEMKSPKADVPQVLKTAHPDIYNGAMLNTSSTLQASMRSNIKNVMDVSLGKTSSLGRSLSR